MSGLCTRFARVSSLQVGDPAPVLVLPDQHRARYDITSYRDDKAVLLVFFPFAFSGVCTGELSGFRDRLGDFESDRVTLAAISCDPVYSQRAFADRDGLFFPLLSDYWPHGEVCTAYGVFDTENGAATRSSVLVDRDGVVRWSVHNELGTPRDLDEHAVAVAELD